jgi:thiosulfate/3-mercaptopyruvate sulfurtransferase
MPSPLLSAQELITLHQTRAIVLIDVRTGVGIKERYAAQHLQGALWIDLDTDLAHIGTDAAKGGRHPLPPIAQFATVLTRLGIRPESHVIAYDDKSGANAAARFWWMLRAMGHASVQVLNGGYDAAIQAGFPTSDTIPIPSPALPYPTPTTWMLPLSDINEVAKSVQDTTSNLVIDVRDQYRFDGKSEPIDLIAGHIPGAINIPFSSNLDENGLYLSPELLQNKYKNALAGRNLENITVHCGSGITACHTLLAMDYTGLGIPKLYVGSWSEWSRNDRPIGKNDIRIIDYAPMYKEVFKDLNVEWISTYFVMEAADYKALDNPETYILEKGGHILVALYNDEPVGVCALIKTHDDPEMDYELAKMAVSPKAQGKKIGWIMGQAAIEKAKTLGAKALFLESNTILTPAISLYYKLGFQKIDTRPSPYERSNIQMKLEIL